MKYKSDDLINKARYYIGYLEKKSDKDLDNFTANAGDKNYTRFCRDYEKYTGTSWFQPSPWCAEFVSCMVVEAYGLDAAKNLLCGALVHSCTTCREQFKKKNQFHTENPIPGDIILFYNSSKNALAHCGIVTKVNSTTITTVEGNTSSGNNVIIDNGGAVSEKSYSSTNTRIAGYCRMALDDTDPTAMNVENKNVASYQEWLNKNYSSGLAVDGSYGKNTKIASIKAMQKYLNATFGTSLSIDGSWGPKTDAAACYLRQGYKCTPVYILQGVLYGLGYDPDGFDGSYGPGCEKAVENFQIKYLSSSKANGICGPETWEKMFT